MPISKRTIDKSRIRNKQIARKIASHFGLKYHITTTRTGTVYLYLRYYYSNTSTAHKQTVVRISNHAGNDIKGFDVDVVVFKEENPDDFFQDSISRIREHIIKNEGLCEKKIN